MKERVGFVSNSSSCSFICNLCGKMEEGWDWDEIPSMGDLLRCEKGHLLCREHFSFMKTKPDPQRVASKFCPLCRASANSLKEYLLRSLVKL